MAATMSIIPEYILCDALNNVLAFIRKDYTTKSDKTKSLLYILTKGPSLQRMDYYDQLVKAIVTTKTNPRHLEVELIYNIKKERSPAIYISLPAEQQLAGTIGHGEGYRDAEFIDDTWAPVYTRWKAATYNFVITSDNQQEVVYLFHFLQSLLLSLGTTLALRGPFRNQKVGGGEVRLYSELVPDSMFIRVVSLGLEYELSAIDLSQYPVINNIIVNGIPVEEVTPPNYIPDNPNGEVSIGTDEESGEESN